ncbi:MAG TPA: c-type cytochrome [Gemmataceae bacterium]|nr:c-type cytochrome [Gemmataceae bacterium]
MRRGKLIFGCITLIFTLATGTNPHASATAQDKQDALIKRGDYLVNNVGRCAECHTARKANGELDNAKHLQGSPTWFAPNPGIKFKKWDKSAPDLTQSGRAGKWTEERLVKFLSTGEQANAPMPAYKMTLEDAQAVTAYLRSLPGTKKKGVEE